MSIDKLSLTNNPLDFWKSHSKEFPLLCKLAKHICSIPATSCDIDRQFSRVGLVVNQRRTNKSPGHVENIFLIRSFQKLNQAVAFH